jgi:hypothetical protein
MELDSGLRRNDERGKTAGSSLAMTALQYVMRGLDPRIWPREEDGRVKHGHDVVGTRKLDSGLRRNDERGKTAGSSLAMT